MIEWKPDCYYIPFDEYSRGHYCSLHAFHNNCFFMSKLIVKGSAGTRNNLLLYPEQKSDVAGCYKNQPAFFAHLRILRFAFCRWYGQGQALPLRHLFDICSTLVRLMFDTGVCFPEGVSKVSRRKDEGNPNEWIHNIQPLHGFKDKHLYDMLL